MGEAYKRFTGFVEAACHVGRSPMKQRWVAGLVSLNEESCGFKND
jgi:hypothetical protein